MRKKPATSEDWAKYGMEGGSSNSRLVSFLYCLGRDALSIGAIETIWHSQVRDEALNDEVHTIDFTNGYLLKWAENLAERLQGNYGE